MTAARDNRRRKAKARKRLRDWRIKRAVTQRWRMVDLLEELSPLAFAWWIGGAR